MSSQSSTPTPLTSSQSLKYQGSSGLLWNLQVVVLGVQLVEGGESYHTSSSGDPSILETKVGLSEGGVQGHKPKTQG